MAQLTFATIGATILLLAVGRAFPGPAHYGLAAGVGLATLVLCVLSFRRARDRSLRGPALVALVLVLAQGAYGALAARWRLPAPAAAGLVVLSMLYLLALVYLAFRVHAAGAAAAPPAAAPPAQRTVVLAAGVVLLLQIVLGAVVRHAGAGAACGDDPFLCGGRVWPTPWPEALLQGHRILGWVLLFALGGAHVVALRAARRLERPLALHLARLAAVLVAVQVGLGLWGVASWTAAHVIAAHLAVAGLLLANLGALYLALGPLGAVVRAPGDAAAAVARPEPGPTRTVGVVATDHGQ